MTGWEIAAVALLPAFAIPAIIASRGGTLDRLIAVQLATVVATVLLVLLTFAFDQSSFIDIAVALPLLALPGTLLMAHVLERWV